MNFAKLNMPAGAVLFALAVALTGCGSSDSPSQGVLLDSAVDGVSYSGNFGSSGVTANGGKFQFYAGEDVTFSIGKMTLGHALGQATVTPADFVGADGQAGSYTTRVLRVLQTLDSDDDPSNGITITPAMRSAATMTVDLAHAADADVLSAVQQARPAVTTLVSAGRALEHFATTLASHDMTLATPSGTAVTLTLMHTNDTHSRMESFTDTVLQGGVARRKTLVNQVRAEVGADSASHSTLLVDAGDWSMGTVFYNAWEGSESMMAMNDMGYDAATLGNHEFDLGPVRLARALRGGAITIAGTSYPTEKPNFPVLASNLDTTAETSLRGLLDKVTIVTKGGQKYGLIGIDTSDLHNISSPGDSIKVLDYVQTVNDAAALLARLGINKIILLSHYGYSVDIAKVKELSGVDIVVSGHDHALLGDAATITAATSDGKAYTQSGHIVGAYPTELTDKDGNTVEVISAYEWGRWLGRLDVKFDADGHVVKGSTVNKSMFVDGRTLAEEAGLAAKVATYKAPVDAFANVKVGTSSMLFSSSRGTASPYVVGVRTGETELGDLVVDIMANAAKVTDKAVAAFSNGGGLRADIPAGDVTFGTALSVLPFGNTLFVMDLTGQDVINLMEASVSKIGGGGFLQLSKDLRMTYCASATGCANPLIAGGQVTSVSIGGTAVNPSATYRLATNNFTGLGGDGYTVLADACARAGNYCRDTGVVLLDLLVDQLKTGTPLSATLDGRITRQ